MSGQVIDYSKTLRRSLADGKTLDQARSQLRAEGASVFYCIATLRAFRYTACTFDLIDGHERNGS